MSQLNKIINHKETMEKYGANKNVLRYSSVHDSLFEKCTFLWFCQKRALGEPVTGPVLQAKAKQFHASLNVDSNFSTKTSRDKMFKYQRKKNFQQMKTTPVCFERIFPPKLVCRTETEAPGRKASKDRVTIQVCWNASGTHKIPLTIIGKSEHPRCLKNVSTSIVYRAQEKSWMDRNVFIDWYKNVFIPSVKKRNPDPEA
ncbi:hypothetical protein NQ318_012232, partial [Aromia moschata]